MDSFNTDADTRRIVQKYTAGRVRVLTFKQSRYPRILKGSLLPAPSSATDDHAKWYLHDPLITLAIMQRYPPGHGDMFDALANSGLLDQLIGEGTHRSESAVSRHRVHFCQQH